MFFDRSTTTLVHCFLLGDVTFREDELPVMSWWCYVWCYKELIDIVGLSFFFVILLVFLGCVHMQGR
jgi:hypothetical protein